MEYPLAQRGRALMDREVTARLAAAMPAAGGMLEALRAGSAGPSPRP